MKAEDIYTKLSARFPEMIMVNSDTCIEGFAAHRDMHTIQGMFPRMTYSFIVEEMQGLMKEYGVGPNPIRFMIPADSNPAERLSNPLAIDIMEEAIFSPDSTIMIKGGRDPQNSSNILLLVTAIKGKVVVATEKTSFLI